MLKAQIYAIVIARFIIILIGYCLAGPFFILQVLGQIGSIYLTQFFSFLASTREQIAHFDNELNKAK